MILSIRKKQFQVFIEASQKNFIQRSICELQQSMPTEIKALGCAADEYPKLLFGWQEKAQGFGIETEADILRFFECCLTHGVDFPAGKARAWAQPVLERSDLDGTQKMDMIIDLEIMQISQQ